MSPRCAHVTIVMARYRATVRYAAGTRPEIPVPLAPDMLSHRSQQSPLLLLVQVYEVRTELPLVSCICSSTYVPDPALCATELTPVRSRHNPFTSSATQTDPRLAVLGPLPGWNLTAGNPLSYLCGRRSSLRLYHSPDTRSSSSFRLEQADIPPADHRVHRRIRSTSTANSFRAIDVSSYTSSSQGTAVKSQSDQTSPALLFPVKLLLGTVCCGWLPKGNSSRSRC